MVRKGLIVAALMALASPLAAQEEYNWTSNRPDGHAPLGIFDGRTLGEGQVEFSYRFTQLNSKGVWFQSDSLPLESTLEIYEVAPLSLVNQTHIFAIAVGATENLTFSANIDYSTRQREQLTADGIFYVTKAEELGDLKINALYTFVNSGPYRAHIQIGGLIPTGEASVVAETPFSSPDTEELPYDMRPGAGTLALLPGMTVQVQNEMASVGAQIKGTIPFGRNDRRFSIGNRYQATGWAAYRLSEYFSVSARVKWQKWTGINGADPELDPLRDPGNDGFFLKGERIDIPVGLNFLMPEDSRFAGHRLAIEATFPVQHEYQGAQLGLDWGLSAGWQVVF
jgi:hypothetical protein